MTQEDQKEQNENQSEDNLMAELDAFNDGSSPDAEEEANAKPDDNADQSAENVQESQSVEKAEEAVAVVKHKYIQFKNALSDWWNN